MAISVVMPALEMAQETGKLVAWRKKEGERVTKGEPLLEIETDKAVMEIESPGDGILAGVKVQEGTEVPVGQTIAWIVAPGEKPPAEEQTVISGRADTTAAARASAATAPEPVLPKAGDGARLSPKARRLAREHGIDISQVRGTGPDGAILTEDIMAAVERKTAPAAPAADALSAVARLMAERTEQSWTSVPHFFVTREADCQALIDFREQVSGAIEKKQGAKPSYTDLLVALVARVLAKHPRMNASWTGDSIRENSEINVAVAMAVNDGVVAPVIHNAGKADLESIAALARDLAERARTGHLRPADITGGTFTLSNLGMYAVDAFTAIITPPQAAILAVGSIVDRVVAIGGKPAVRPRMHLTLSTDHRVADGARAAAFLGDLVAAIRDPKTLLG